MLIDKEKREALVMRLRARYLETGARAREAHLAAHAAGQLATLHDAYTGAQNNVLQLVITDLDAILSGIDPTAEGVRPLDNTLPSALAAAQRAIGSYLASFEGDTDDATRLMLLGELETTLKLLQEYVPVRVLDAILAGAGVDGAGPGSYRACYYVAPDGQSETVLTGPEHAAFSDNELYTEAMAEAIRADLIGDVAPRITHQAFLDGLRIGPWKV